MDRYGIIDESVLLLRFPRDLDSTHATIEGCLSAALDLLRDGAEKVAIFAVGGHVKGVPHEGELLLTLTAADGFEAHEEGDNGE